MVHGIFNLFNTLHVDRMWHKLHSCYGIYYRHLISADQQSEITGAIHRS